MRNKIKKFINSNLDWCAHKVDYFVDNKSIVIAFIPVALLLFYCGVLLIINAFFYSISGKEV